MNTASTKAQQLSRKSTILLGMTLGALLLMGGLSVTFAQELDLLGAGGILDQLYGLGNLTRINDEDDQWWINRDGTATARAKFAAFTQTLGFIDASQVFQPLFTEIGDGFDVSASGTLPSQDALSLFRWGLNEWSSRLGDNADQVDHMFTWLITDGPSAGNLVIAWEDLPGPGGDYQDLVVEISNVSPAQLVNDLVSLDPSVGTVFDMRPVSGAPAGTFTITARFTNSSATPIVHPFFEVIELSGDNVLLNADGRVGRVGATLTPTVDEGVWVPGEAVTVEFVVGLSSQRPFTFLVNLLGIPMASAQDVYVNDFENPADPLREWFNISTDTTPVGARRFLGQFGNDTVSLTLTDLPPHVSIRVSFDLFIIASMDGNNTEFGPDIWSLSVAGGTTLLHTTFSNAFASELDFRQAYPDMSPGGDHPGLAGAAENDTLGYSDVSEYAGANDSVYRLSFTFPHLGNTLTLNFSGVGQEGVGDESWGLDNVRVTIEGIPFTTFTSRNGGAVPR